MELLTETRISTEAGVAGDCRGRPGNRQVTVLAADGWAAACGEAGIDLPWSARRANLLVRGLDLRQTTGRVLLLGDEVALIITGELEPCERMDEAAPGLRAALLPTWRGGVTCRVRQGGLLRTGDTVRFQT